MRARALALVILACVPRAAFAEPRAIETSGFVGFNYFPDDIELGNSWAPEQVPNTAPVVGARVGWVVLPALGAGVQLAVEAELSIATARTGGSEVAGGGERMSYFAPVFGWRAHAALRRAGRSIRPHLVAGAGGETIASSSPFMAKETDPVVYWGPGVELALSDHWRMRVDLRHGIMAARDAGTTSTIELQIGLATTLGGRARTAPPPRPAPEPPPVDPDRDGDGVAGARDRCPAEPELVNGVDDADGCPEPDPDGDRIVGPADACPAAAEDLDRHADEDGCPDPDNDGDGIADDRDACADRPETVNAIADADGCPDQVPEEVTRALAGAAAIRFQPRSARVTPGIRTALAPVLDALTTYRELRLVVVGRPARRGGDALARRRADAIKWHLVDRGVPEDRITTRVAAPGTPTIELTLAPK